MQTPGMNKLARPDCPQCRGAGKVRIPISLGRPGPGVEAPPGKSKTVGFMFATCAACNGEGKR